MREPHRCPVCDGTGKRNGDRDCQACDGKGVVWPPNESEEAAAPAVGPSGNPRDLTYDG